MIFESLINNNCKLIIFTLKIKKKIFLMITHDIFMN